MSYNIETHRDFKRYYDTTRKINIWVLGYFGGYATYISEAMKLAEQYAKANNIPLDTVVIDTINNSRRYKGFKFIYSYKEQLPELNSTALDDVWGWLTD